MKFQKNNLSFILWVFYSVIVLCFSALFFTGFATKIGRDSGIGLVFVLILMVVSTGIVFFSEHIRRSKQWRANIDVKKKSITTYVIAAILLVAGVAIRFIRLKQGNIDAGVYFDLLKVDGSEMPYDFHGALEIYYLVLKLTFFLLGNNIRMATGLQIIMQIGAAVLIFFSIKQIAGRITSLAAFAFMMLSEMMTNLSLTLGPSSLYLLLVAGEAFYLINIIAKSKYELPFLISSAAICGILIYFDFAAAILLVLFCALLMWPVNYSNKPGDINVLGPMLFTFVGATIGGFLLSFVFTSMASGYTFAEIAHEQIVLHTPKEFGVYRLVQMLDPVFGIVLSITLMIGIFSGFRRHEKDQGSYVMFSVIVAVLLTGFSLSGASVVGEQYIVICLSILGGAAIDNVFSPLPEYAPGGVAERSWARKRKAEKANKDEDYIDKESRKAQKAEEAAEARRIKAEKVSEHKALKLQQAEEAKRLKEESISEAKRAKIEAAEAVKRQKEAEAETLRKIKEEKAEVARQIKLEKAENKRKIKEGNHPAVNLALLNGSDDVVFKADDERTNTVRTNNVPPVKTKSVITYVSDIEMLENPLPVPKKVEKEVLEYDYYVPYDAEYDI